MADSTIKIGQLSVTDLPAIARVHVEAFPGSSTTRLGKEAVRRYYEWQFVGPHKAHYFGAWADGQLAGFCFCGRFRGALTGYVNSHKWYLAWCMATRPWLILHEDVRSAVRTSFRLLGRRRAGGGIVEGVASRRSFGILAIAVAPNCQRLGLGGRLMSEAEKTAESLGCDTLGLTVSPENAPAIEFYQKLGWVPVSDGGAWRGRMEKAIEIH